MSQPWRSSVVRRSGGRSSVGAVTDPTPPRPGSPGAPLWDPTAIPAATVVVVRDGRSSSDGPGGLEVLVLRRDRDLSFAGGTWVFPGGRIDPADHPVGGQDLELAARTAAVREANEEAGLVIDPSRLRRWSHWTPPPESPKRFSTAFFVAPLPDGAGDVVIDDGEIREHAWRGPGEMLELHAAGEVSLTPPTFITLTQLLGFTSSSDVVEADRAVEHFATRITVVGESVIAMYHGDPGYESGDPGSAGPLTGPLTDGPLHRLVMGQKWTYVRQTPMPDV